MKLNQLFALSFLLFISMVPVGCIGCFFNSGASENEVSSSSENDTEFREDDNEATSGSSTTGGFSELKDAMKKLNESVQSMQDGKSVEVVNFRDLKELLPKRVAGMDRTKHTGEKTGMLGFKVSMAEATYEDDGKRLTIKVMDTGGTGIAALGGAAWTSLDIDRETDTGYERTFTQDGQKGYEKYDSQTKRGETSLFVGQRFYIQVTGYKVSESDMNDARDVIDLDDLVDLQQ